MQVNSDVHCHSRLLFKPKPNGSGREYQLSPRRRVSHDITYLAVLAPRNGTALLLRFSCWAVPLLSNLPGPCRQVALRVVLHFGLPKPTEGPWTARVQPARGRSPQAPRVDLPAGRGSQGKGRMGC